MESRAALISPGCIKQTVSVQILYKAVLTYSWRAIGASCYHMHPSEDVFHYYVDNNNVLKVIMFRRCPDTEPWVVLDAAEYECV